MPCQCPDGGSISLTSALNCFLPAPKLCTHRETSAASVDVQGLHCTNHSTTGNRGFFVASRDANGSPVCTGGDAFHVRAVSYDWQFSALSQPVGESRPFAYWINMSNTGVAGGTHQYKLSISLVETAHRSLQQGEGRSSLRWTAEGSESHLQDWLRDSKCAWQRVPLAAENGLIQVTSDAPLRASLPACTFMPPASAFAYRRVNPSCPPGSAVRCPDNHTRRRILDTTNDQRLQKRRAQGFDHVLASSQCQLRWFGESGLARCLAGRSVLNMGSEAVDLQRGFARINKSLSSWTRTRPGPKHPNVADFHRAFEKPWQQCFLPKGQCDVRFGSSLFRTVLKRGLVELLPEAAVAPSGTRSTTSGAPPSRRRSNSRTREELLSLMCAHDVVIFESGLADVALPLTELSPLRDRSLLRPACGGAPAAACQAVLPRALKNETWRQTPLAAYRNRLHALLEVWKGCKRAKPGWRGVFKLALAPRARALRDGAPEAADCERAQSGYSATAHHVAVVNSVARRAVEEAGFEVFDPWAATLHASASWFDALPTARGRKRNSRGEVEGRGLEYEVHSAEAVSDMVTQMLINQLCTPA